MTSDKRGSREGNEPDSLLRGVLRLMVPAVFGAVLLWGGFSASSYPVIGVVALLLFIGYMLWRLFNIFTAPGRMDGRGGTVAEAVEIGLLSIFAIGTGFQLLPSLGNLWLLVHAILFALLAGVAGLPELAVLALSAAMVGYSSLKVTELGFFAAFISLYSVAIASHLAISLERNRSKRLKSKMERLKMDIGRRSSVGEGSRVLATMDRTISETLQEIRRGVGAHCAILALKTPQGGLYVKAMVNDGGEAHHDAGVRLKGTAFHWVLNNRKESVIPSIKDPAAMLGCYDNKVPIRSFAGVPLFVGGRVEGVLGVDSLKEDAFPPDLMVLLRLSAKQLGSIVYHFQESANSAILVKDMRTFREYSRLISMSASDGELPAITLKVLEERITPDIVILAVLTTESEIEVLDARGEGEEQLAGSAGSIEGSLAQWVLGSNKYLHCSSSKEIPEKPSLSDSISTGKFETLLIMPVSARGSAVGVIVSGWKEANSLDASGLDFCSVIARHLALALLHSRDMSELERLRLVDEHTGLKTHTGFVTHLEHEELRSKRYESTHAVVIFEIDQFSAIAQGHGNGALAALLSHLGSVVKNNLRESDIAAYLGGGRFALSLYEVDGEGALKMAERFVRLVASTSVEWREVKIRFTGSFGVSSWRGEADSHIELAGRAEKAMYTSRRAGGNRATLHED
ncbi:MAG: hypothetical protein C0609_03085 [Deltaproteobacteria bacterium]|nr:MAG: hypothetical protein C0609_03085 [Deltaproteobacteria bacterium]